MQSGTADCCLSISSIKHRYLLQRDQVRMKISSERAGGYSASLKAAAETSGDPVPGMSHCGRLETL